MWFGGVVVRVLPFAMVFFESQQEGEFSERTYIHMMGSRSESNCGKMFTAGLDRNTGFTIGHRVDVEVGNQTND